MSHDPTAPRETLAPHEVHLWCAPVPPQIDPALWARYEALLNDEERARLWRFHFDKDRRRFLVTRALVRTVLSRHAGIAPAAWQFAPNAHGRPAIANPEPEAQRLCFNLTHSNTLVVLGLTAGREIGIDTESTDRDAPLEVADRYFSERESQALRALPPDDQPARFWDLWTFKESYIKARGMGLALPLDGFSYRFDAPGHVDIGFEPKITDDPARWALWQFRPDATHLLAVCLEHRTQPTAFVLREVQPMLSERRLDDTPTRRSPR
jgi:4'-phosphopantetheinyl transferase